MPKRFLVRFFLTFSFAALALGCLLSGSVPSVGAQSLDRISRDRAKDMLKAVKNTLKDEYYDPTFGGVDLEAKFKAADEKLSSAASMGQAFGIIAQVVLDLNDSHTKYFPPARAASIEYGWRMQMFGDKCLVTAVKTGSDAEKKGLKPGDQIVQIEGFRPNRKDMWKINYYYNAISPRQGLALKVMSPGETTPREISLASKVTQGKAILNFEDLVRQFELESGSGSVVHRFVRVGSTAIWKMPSFAIDPDSLDGVMKGRIRESNNLILDLRGNGGGYVVALERLLGYFVDKDTEIATLKGRKPMKPMLAKTAGKNIYTGKLTVLIDSNSASASELFARFVQLNQRGVVIGERSAGAVMQSRSFPMKMGADSIVPYGMSITNADVIMSDGGNLEHKGVVPQIELIRSPADLNLQHDPVIAAALKLLGHDVTPEAAGKLFPVKWDDVE